MLNSRWLGILLALLALAVLLSACATATPAPTATTAPTSNATPTPATTSTTASGGTTVTVFAASSLTDSFKEIGAQFQAAHPGVKVNFNFAGSQQLRAQLEQGARADVFASANATEMTNARDKGLVGNDDEVFVMNRLIVILPKNNPGKITQLQDLSKPGLKVVIADPSVPVGQYASQMLDKMSADPTFGANFKAQVMKNVVSQETDVKQVVAKVQLGEADAGVVYTTDAQAAASALTPLTIPDKFNQIASYPIVALKAAPQPQLAQAFVAYVLAAEGGQKILQKWGFIPASPEIVATQNITVIAASGNKTVLSPSDLKALPRVEVKQYALVGKTRGPLGTADYAGAALKDVLLKADPSLSASSAISITLTAGDGFKVTVTPQEAFAPQATSQRF